MADSSGMSPMVLPLSAAGGLLLALCISLAVRLETGYPPGIVPEPFAHLLGQPAPGFEITGLGDGLVALHTLTSAAKDRRRTRIAVLHQFRLLGLRCDLSGVGEGRDSVAGSRSWRGSGEGSANQTGAARNSRHRRV